MTRKMQPSDIDSIGDTLFIIWSLGSECRVAAGKVHENIRRAARGNTHLKQRHIR